MDKIEREIKKEFQLERMILFSDAVFAIAITLMVIEIKVPHIEGEISDSAIGQSLFHLIPVFFGFLLSFFIIGIYWTVHHRIFGHLLNFDNKLLWLNLFFLLSIIIMPFTSGLYGEFYQPDLMLPNIIYTANICFTGLCNYFLIRHISNPEKKLSEVFSDKNYLRLSYARSLMMPVLFIFGLILSFLFVPWIGRFTPMLTPFYLMIVERRFRKRIVSATK